MTQVVDDSLEADRNAAGRRASREAYELLHSADENGALTAEDLENLTITWLLGQFGETLSRARQRYGAFVADGGGPNLSSEVTAGLFVGSEEFIARVTRGEDELAEIPRRQLQPLVPPLRELFANHGDEAIAVAAREYGYRLREIADHLGVHYATVSRRLRRLEAQRATS